MPFSDTTEEHTEEYWTIHFENFIKIEIEKIPGLKSFRSEALREDIMKDIVKNLVTSDIVVAELTDYNSNVFYELGIRQSIRYGTITIAEKGTVLPFDIGRKGTLFYDPAELIKDTKFTIMLNKALIDCIEEPEKSDSVVLDVLTEMEPIDKHQEIPKKIILLIDKMIMDITDNVIDKFFSENYQNLEKLAINVNWKEADPELLNKYKIIRKYYEDNYGTTAVLEAFKKINDIF